MNAFGVDASIYDVEGAEGSVIAVIEDEAIVLAGYKMLLESCGYRVMAAPSCADALAQLAEQGLSPAFILADYRLKDGETGTDAIQTVRAVHGQGIPSILITGDTAVDRLREVAASGLPVLHKPVRGSQLLEAVRKALAAMG